MKKVIIISLLFLLLSACSKTAEVVTDTPAETSKQATNLPTENKTNEGSLEGAPITHVTEQEQSIETETNKFHLLTEPIPNYNPNEVVTINYDGKVYDTTFVKVKYTDVGLYLPTNMQMATYEDGEVFYFESEASQIVITKYYTSNAEVFNEKTNRTITEFEPYAEYQGSYDYAYAYALTFLEDPKIDDSEPENAVKSYFLFEHQNQAILANVAYTVRTKKKAIPLFLEVLKTIRYVQ